LRERLMQAAGSVLDRQRQTGRTCNTEVFACEVADHAGIDLPTLREYNIFLPWVIKAREMAEYERERARANGGQYSLL
jgi:hypothetical protein